MAQSCFLSLPSSSDPLKPELSQVSPHLFCSLSRFLLSQRLAVVQVFVQPQEAKGRSDLALLEEADRLSLPGSGPNFCDPYGSADTHGQQFLGYVVWQQPTHRYSLLSSFAGDSCG